MNKALRLDPSHAGDAFIVPEWPAPPRVRALITTRNGGYSRGPYAGNDSARHDHSGNNHSGNNRLGGLNLGSGCGDSPEDVAANRALLRRRLPADPRWLHQVHGRRVIDAAKIGAEENEPDADASFTFERHIVCAVQMADCMPILLCDREGAAVAAAHAGWRGMASGVIEATVAAMDLAPERLLAYLGPAIGPNAFEVGGEVRAAFVAHDPGARSCFRRLPAARKWLGDIESLARRRLASLGVTQVFGGGRCTFSEPEHFYSYRRDGVTGRMAALIWIE